MDDTKRFKIVKEGDILSTYQVEPDGVKILLFEVDMNTKEIIYNGIMVDYTDDSVINFEIEL